MEAVERIINARRQRRLHDHHQQGIAVIQALRASQEPQEQPAPEPCPICGRGTAGGHRHAAKAQELAPVRKIGGGR